MQLGGTFISSIDYPGKISLVVYTRGCELKCIYCHNPELIQCSTETPIENIYNKIDEFEDYIDSVTITGGEPIIHYKTVHNIFNYAKKKGLKTKLDTNGNYPEKIKEIMKNVDYLSLDIKAPEYKYEEITGVNIWKEVIKTMNMIYNAPDTFLECRTTYVPKILNQEDLISIAKSIKCDLYTLQQFRNKIVLDPELKDVDAPKPQELQEIAKNIKTYLKNVKIKTAEFGEEKI